MEEQVDWNYGYYMDLILEERPDEMESAAYHSYDDLLLRDEADFGRIGEVLPYRIGEYVASSPEFDEEPEEEIHMLVSEDGIWAIYDPDTGEVLDCGIMIPDRGPYSDIWYSVNAEGEFMTFFEFDYGTLSCSKYGWFGYEWPDD